jgi:hypothetical protein
MKIGLRIRRSMAQPGVQKRLGASLLNIPGCALPLPQGWIAPIRDGAECQLPIIPVGSTGRCNTA